MSPVLHPLFEAIATAPSEEVLRARLMDAASEAFAVQRWGIYLANEEGGLKSADAVGVSEDFIDRYQKFGIQVDPVLKYVSQYHAPAHEELVLPRGTWRQSELYQRCCSQHDHAHIMTGPIVGRGRLIGTINFARLDENHAFSLQDLANLGAVCSHFSARLAELRQGKHTNNPWLSKLTVRERQIANLVAQGLTNKEIGAELWITQNSVKQALKRMFCKLEVSARTEMVAKLWER